jgi:hypothetical protein
MLGIHQRDNAAGAHFGGIEERPDRGVVGKPYDACERSLAVQPPGDADLPQVVHRVRGAGPDEQFAVVVIEPGAIPERRLQREVDTHQIRPAAHPDRALGIGDVQVQCQIRQHSGLALPVG